LGTIFIVILFHHCPHVAGDCRVQYSTAPAGQTKALWKWFCHVPRVHHSWLLTFHLRCF